MNHEYKIRVTSTFFFVHHAAFTIRVSNTLCARHHVEVVVHDVKSISLQFYNEFN